MFTEREGMRDREWKASPDLHMLELLQVTYTKFLLFLLRGIQMAYVKVPRTLFSICWPINTDTILLQKLAAVSPGQLMSCPHRRNVPNSYLETFEILKQLVYIFLSQYTIFCISSYLLWNRRQFVLNSVLQTGGLIKQVYWLSLRLWLKTGKHIVPLLVFLSK